MKRAFALAIFCMLMALVGCGGGGGGVQATSTVEPGSPTSPAAPQGLAAVPGNNHARVSWHSVSGASSYNLYWSTSPGVTRSTATKVPDFANGGILSSLSSGTRYYLAVEAVNSDGIRSDLSNEVEVVPREGATFLAWTGSADSSNAFRLVRVNGQTGLVTNIGGCDFFSGLAYSPNGTLYGVASDLQVINPADGRTLKVGDFYYSGRLVLMTAASFTPDGTLYVVENAPPNRIFRANLTTAALTYVGTPPETVRSIAFSGGGTLYGGFASLYALRSDDASTTCTTGSIGAYIGSMSFGSDGNLYGIDIYPSTNLYNISLSTGVAASVTGLGSGNLAAIVQERPGSGAYRVAPDSQAKSPEELLAIEKRYKRERVGGRSK